MSTQESKIDNQYPDHRYAWFMVIMLTLAYVFSFIDRYILGILVEPIKADLGLTDTQIGLLLGPAFGLVYAFAGLPLGWLADRKRRTYIVAAGIAFWSLATAATGFAKSFVQVFIARMGVGIGEAALSPCAMSIISDSFPPERRGKPVGFYSMALSLGAAIASLVAAAVLVLANSLPLGGFEPWQFTFIALGVPGVIIAVVFFFLKEPRRVESQSQDKGAEKAGFTDMLKHIGKNPIPFFGVIVLQSSMMVIAYSQGWLAAVFERTWEWAPEKYASVNGIVLLVFGPASVLFSGWLSDRFFKSGRRNASYLIMVAGLLVTVPTAVFATLMPSGEWAFVWLAINTVGIATATAAGPVALINITPGQFRGQIMAMYYMIGSIAGLGLGPTLVGVFSEDLFGPENLNYAFSLTSLVIGVPGLAFGLYARKIYNKELESRLESAS